MSADHLLEREILGTGEADGIERRVDALLNHSGDLEQAEHPRRLARDGLSRRGSTSTWLFVHGMNDTSY
jgi:hypothetical protein